MKESVKVYEAHIKKIYSNVIWTHKIHEKQAEIYSRHYKFLETFKISLSACSVAGILSVLFRDEFVLRLITAIITMLSFGIASYFKSFDLQEKISMHKGSAVQLISVREQIISLLCDLRVKELTNEEIEEKRDNVLKRLEDIYSNCLDTSKKAVKLAEKALEEYEKNVYTEERIDIFLPKQLSSLMNMEY